MTPRVALATCADFPELPDDEGLVIPELSKRGVHAEPVVWDDPAVDWADYDLVVTRSTWDYPRRREAFLRWTRSVPRMLNDPAVVAWNTDKRYLLEIPHATPTRLVEPGDAFAPPDGEYVIKPTVSAGSRDTARYGPGDDDRAAEHADTLLSAGRAVLVQPYLSAVDDIGETAVLFFGGDYSHAICKAPLLLPGRPPESDGLYAPETITTRTPSDRELAVAGDVLDGLAWDRRELLYARVDLIPGADGEPLVAELELCEPSLFLSHHPKAPARFADAVRARL